MSFLSPEVGDRGEQSLRLLVEKSYRRVASAAEKSAHATSPVLMVDRKPLGRAAESGRLRSLTDSAYAALNDQQSFILSGSEAVVPALGRVVFGSTVFRVCGSPLAAQGINRLPFLRRPHRSTLALLGRKALLVGGTPSRARGIQANLVRSAPIVAAFGMLSRPLRVICANLLACFRHDSYYAGAGA